MTAPKVPQKTVIDGETVLDDLHSAVTKFCVLPSEDHEYAVVLWIVATHCLPAFDYATRLVIRSAEKRSGKTRLMEILAETCWNPLRAMNATTAAIFRSLDGEHPPTLLLDEADTIFGSKRVAENNEDLRGLLNAGFQRGTPVLRTVGPQHTPTEFPTFTMTALAGIGKMPDTIEDRAVVVPMRRRKPSEKVQPYRIRRDKPELIEVATRVSEWAADMIDTLTYAEPNMPVEDRAADTWEPLVAVADAAGGHWPQRARQACTKLTSEAEETDGEASLNVRLVSDIREIFTTQGRPFLRSQVLIEYLHGVEESPWRDFDLNTNKLSRRLRDYGVKPGRDTSGTERGYRLEDFYDTFDRYLPTVEPSPRQNMSEPSKTPEYQGITSDTFEASDTLTRQTQLNPSDEKPRNISEKATSDTFGQVYGKKLGLGPIPIT